MDPMGPRLLKSVVYVLTSCMTILKDCPKNSRPSDSCGGGHKRNETLFTYKSDLKKNQKEKRLRKAFEKKARHSPFFLQEIFFSLRVY